MRQTKVERFSRNAECATPPAGCCFSKTNYRAGCTMTSRRLATFFSIGLIGLASSKAAGAPRIAPPPAGKLYQGLYFDEPAARHDPTEHDVTAGDVARLVQTLGAKTAWGFFLRN